MGGWEEVPLAKNGGARENSPENSKAFFMLNVGENALVLCQSLIVGFQES